MRRVPTTGTRSTTVTSSPITVVERVPVVGTRRIGRSRYRDALQVRRRADRELREHPAVGYLVVLDDWIAVVVGLAAAAKTSPQRVAGLGKARGDCAGCLVEYGKRFIHPLDVLRRTDGPVRIGRRRVGDES